MPRQSSHDSSSPARASHDRSSHVTSSVRSSLHSSLVRSLAWRLALATMGLLVAGATLVQPLHAQAQTGAQMQTPRKFVERAWVGIWRVGGATDEELFAFPRELLATKDGVYVLDVGTLELIAFDQLGRKRWVAGSKGKGPGQFVRPVDLTLAPNGDIAVLDPGNARVAYFEPSGRFRRSVPSPGAAIATSVCITADSRTHFWVGRPKSDVLTLANNGKVVAERGFPWRVQSGAPPFLRTSYFARSASASDCAFASLFGYGIGRVNASGITVSSPYVETVATPVLKEERTRDGGSRSTLVDGVNAALAAMRSGDTVLVHFAGSSSLSHRLIDLYTPGGYLETWTTPGCGRVAYYPPWLYCMTNMSEAARLVAFTAKSDTAAVLKLFPKAVQTSKAQGARPRKRQRTDSSHIQPAR